MNRIIGGWEVDSIVRFQTGQPILVTSGVTGGNTFNNNGPGINLVGLTRQQIQSMLTTNKTEIAGAVTYVPTNLLASNLQKANTAVFQPCNVAGSLCSKPFFTGPSFFRADISLVKTTKITERVNFEMRMEALNAFNDADFYWAGGAGHFTAHASAPNQHGLGRWAAPTRTALTRTSTRHKIRADALFSWWAELTSKPGSSA